MKPSKCGACSATKFELVEADLSKDSDKRYNFVQCASCGTVIGVTEGIHLSTWMSQIMKKLGMTPH